jgi:hypothetical protein
VIHRIVLKSSPEVKALVLAAFPGYKKHNVSLSEFYSGVNVNSYWDGGSKAEFVIVQLSTMQRKSLPTSSHPYFELHNVTGETADVSFERGCASLKRLPEGFALVEAGTFCGKPATAHIYLNSANITKMLPPPAVQS